VGAYKAARPQLVHMSSGGVERNARIETADDRKACTMPIVQLNPGGTLNHKYFGESAVRNAGVSYTGGLSPSPPLCVCHSCFTVLLTVSLLAVSLCVSLTASPIAASLRVSLVLHCASHRVPLAVSLCVPLSMPPASSQLGASHCVSHHRLSACVAVPLTASLRHTVVRAAGLVTEGLDKAFTLQALQGDRTSGRLSRAEAASVLAAAVSSPYSAGKTFEVRRSDEENAELTHDMEVRNTHPAATWKLALSEWSCREAAGGVNESVCEPSPVHPAGRVSTPADPKVANRIVRVWHGSTENGP
jgi:hypothetical protein